MFGWKLHTLVIQSTTLLVLFLQTVTWPGRYSIDEVCNFLCQNMTVMPKIAPAFPLLYHTHFQRQTRRLNWQTRRFKSKQTRENVYGLCLDANRCKLVPRGALGFPHFKM